MVVTRGAIHRRADITVEHEVEVNGVRLIRATTGRYFAESRSEPERCWYLTGFSCGCPGFAYRQRCEHHAALLVALGWTSPEPESPAALSTACPSCNGTGSECGTAPTARTWRYENTVCGSCHGTGQRVAVAA